ncbi:MAG: hypothetical protein Q9160_003998 [Pyrenula sp. 1 TL-2023]
MVSKVLHVPLCTFAERDLGTTSRQVHAKQKALAQERKAAKPNSDSIARSKKLWEKLRRKSHVPKEERQKLVAELFDIISGHVQDFVFKHDAVRVIQTALKYAIREQRIMIAAELKGDFRRLAEGKYAKFLIGKMLEHGDDEVRDMIVPEFYGHVKQLIRHPEASWIVDDIYRTVATKEQKGRMLLEWYGPEYVVFHDMDPCLPLSAILEMQPEKRRPLMEHLRGMINQMVQKKTTGFTMLHDAILQYFLNLSTGSAEETELFNMLNDDEEGACYKNLAFTAPGSRLVCLLLAKGDAKKRKTILRVFKGVIEMLAFDRCGHRVILTAYDVVDDTRTTSDTILKELLATKFEKEARNEKLLGQATDLTGRISLLYPLSPTKPKWLLPHGDVEVVEEMHRIRTSTSRKDPETRRKELVDTISEPLITVIAEQAAALISSSYGCQFIVETLFGAVGDKTPALKAISALAKEQSNMFDSPHAGRMLKSLVQGGHWDNLRKTVDFVEPPLGFERLLLDGIKPEAVQWAKGSNWRVVLAVMEARDDETSKTLKGVLRTHRLELQEAASADTEVRGLSKSKLLEYLDSDKITI